jgi:hypothetical protein
MVVEAATGGVGHWLTRTGTAIARRPQLWPVALRQVFVLAAPRWWRHWPPLPLPDPAYLRFRLQTQYGDPGRQPEPDDVVTYLHWCRSQTRGLR